MMDISAIGRKELKMHTDTVVHHKVTIGLASHHAKT